MIKNEKTARFYSFHMDPNSDVAPLVRNYRFSLDGKQGFSLVEKRKKLRINSVRIMRSRAKNTTSAALIIVIIKTGEQKHLSH